VRDSNFTYLNLLAYEIIGKKSNASELLPILSEIFEAGLDGSLCVPVKKEWKVLLKKYQLPVVLENIEGIPHIYFEKIHTLKRKLEAALKKQIQQVNTIHFDINKIGSIQSTLESKYSETLNLKFKLNNGQSKAIRQTLSQNFQIISGGPGTGKTTVVAFLLRIMKELNILPEPEEIALVAPTGRAAQRLTESIQHNLKRMGSDSEFNNLFHGQTVHSLLSFNRKEGNFFYNKERALPYRLLIVDEVSMMDLDLMVSLFDALENIETSAAVPFHLILLGDPNQLPSVEKGEVLADFLNELPNQGQHLSHLTESNRHAAGSQIYQLMKYIVPDLEAPSLLESISENSFPTLSSLNAVISDKAEVIWYDFQQENSNQTKRDTIVEQIWESHFIPQMKTVQSWNFQSEEEMKNFSIDVFMSELNRFRCLTIFRTGYLGIEGIQIKIQTLANSYFQKQKQTKSQTKYFRDLATHLYYEGMPIIITKNDRSRKLFNGDVGFICGIGAELRAVFCINNLLFSFAIDTLPKHEPAFFMTVHKSQGSEYETVLFYLPELKQAPNEPEEKNRVHRLLNKKILYTAVTRSKKKVILVCDKKTWKEGLLNDPKRLTGFRIDNI